MVTVLHTCLVLSLPLKMWINVFRNLVDNETRGWYGIKSSPNLQAVLFTTDVRIALISLRWIEKIPDVFSANFSFILRGVPEGSHHSPTSGPSITETSIQSRPCCPFRVDTRSPPCSEQTAGAVAQPVSTENECTTSIFFFRLHDFLHCFSYQVTCSAVTMGDHADQ